MPYSLDEGKDWARKVLADLPIETAVDVGPGAGAWGKLLREIHSDAYLSAVEIWGPYVERFRLGDIYDEIVIADVRYAPDGLFAGEHLVVFGDVLEHMARNDAIMIARHVAALADRVLISLPIVPWEQGPQEGNPYEAHLHHWTDPEMRDTFNVTDSFVGQQVGVYLVTL